MLPPMSILTMEKAAPSLSVVGGGGGRGGGGKVFGEGGACRFVGGRTRVGARAFSRAPARARSTAAQDARTNDGEHELAHGQKLLRHDLAVLSLDERQLGLRGREHRHLARRRAK
jgi:hypothetical protein